MKGNDVSIKYSILHILDKNLGTAVLSENILDTLSLGDYLEKLLASALGDDEIKEVLFGEVHEGISLKAAAARGDLPTFVEFSREMALMFYENITAFDDLPSGDLLVVDFRAEDTQYIGICKLNYRKSYIHYVEKGELDTNAIICQPAALPTASQKVDELIIFNLSDNKVVIKEKKYEIQTEKQFYISKRILEVQEKQTDKEKLRAVKRTVRKVIEKYHPDDMELVMEATAEIADSYTSDGVIDIVEVAEKISRGINSIKEEFVEEIRSKGLEERIPINENLEKAMHKKHRIITEDGVEVKLPMHLFRSKDKFEIINNPDGSLSILIKNVEIR